MIISNAWYHRFGGIEHLYGKESLQFFADAHVCVLGIGGVGSWAVEALVRTGIGSITLIDLDHICITNTNRQIHALQKNIGQSKIEVMATRILEINPECNVTCVNKFITTKNIQELIHQEDFSYIIDAIDSIQAKTALVAWCYRNKVPLVTVCAAGGQIDPTKIEVSDLAKTVHDPIASKLRKELKKNYNIVKNSKNKLNIDCVFSKEAIIYPKSFNENKLELLKHLRCSYSFGAVTMVTATFAFVAVSHILKKMIFKTQ